MEDQDRIIPLWLGHYWREVSGVFDVIKMLAQFVTTSLSDTTREHQTANIYLMAVNNNLKTISEDDLEF